MTAPIVPAESLPPPDQTYHSIICGAGPVGLLCANLLGKRGIPVLIIDKLEKPVGWSRAIGVCPPSLDILADIQLDREFVEKGIHITTVGVHGGGGISDLIGRVSFKEINSAFPFMLAIPQIATEEILTRGLARWPSVTFLRGVQLLDFNQTADGIQVQLQSADAGGTCVSVKSAWLLGCDGLGSRVRGAAGIGFPARRYGDTFVMGDFADLPDAPAGPDFGDEAHLFFTPGGAVESFPLPDGKRRWIVQTTGFVENPDRMLIPATVAGRTGIALDTGGLLWQGPFGVQRAIASCFQRGRVFLLGDAAHIMSPIGGQGMNTGFADAADLMPLIATMKSPADNPHKFRLWESQRRRAFRIAAGRAARSMKLGTVRGGVASHLRNALLWLMLNGPWRARVPVDYAMLSIKRPLTAKKES